MEKQTMSITGKNFERAMSFFTDNGYTVKSGSMHFYTEEEK